MGFPSKLSRAHLFQESWLGASVAKGMPEFPAKFRGAPWWLCTPEAETKLWGQEPGPEGRMVFSPLALIRIQCYTGQGGGGDVRLVSGLRTLGQINCPGLSFSSIKWVQLQFHHTELLPQLTQPV